VKYVLDTNVVARLLDNDARVAPRLKAVATDSVGMPVVVLAELLFAVEKSARREHNRARLQRFAACTALEHDATLITNDAALKDGAIEGLVVEDWLAGDPT
jgi:predicted nucleic acid-binding protein